MFIFVLCIRATMPSFSINLIELATKVNGNVRVWYYTITKTPRYTKYMDTHTQTFTNLDSLASTVHVYQTGYDSLKLSNRKITDTLHNGYHQRDFIFRDKCIVYK